MAGPAKHSREAVQRLADIADGQGGQAVAVIGSGAPYYAGLQRGGAESLLEAVLTLLNPGRYDEVLLITGEGDHLPDLLVSKLNSCARQRLIWLLKGTASAGNKASTANPLLGPLDAVIDQSGDYEVVVPSYLGKWSERMSDLITHVADRLKPGGLRRLVVIDDQFLQPRNQYHQANHDDRPEGGKGAEIEREFKKLPASCSKSRTDLVLICRSRGLADAIVGPGGEGAIAGDLLQVADTEPAQREARRTAGLFSKLVWPNVPVLTLETMSSAQWNAGWLPGADPRQPLYEILRTCPPVPKYDPLAALDRFIGMESVRAELSALRNLLAQEQEQRRRGLPVEPVGLHVALYGQPGTGKTEVAKAIAHIYRELGVLRGPFVACAGRADLVAGYIGQTAIKTRVKLDEARDGVLFIDEAYTLAGKHETDFGKEAIDEMLKFMTEDKDKLAIIVAGYPEPMREFLRSNAGLTRRFTRHINMPEYTDDQLIEILIVQARRSSKSVADEARPIIREKLAAHRRNCAASRLNFGYAGDAGNLMEKAKLAQAQRFQGRPFHTISDEEFSLLTAEDFRAAQLQLPA